MGSPVGNLTMDMEDTPSFEPGDKVPIFLCEDIDQATKSLHLGHFVVCGCFQVSLITEEGKAISEEESTELNEFLKLINASSEVK